MCTRRFENKLQLLRERWVEGRPADEAADRFVGLSLGTRRDFFYRLLPSKQKLYAVDLLALELVATRARRTQEEAHIAQAMACAGKFGIPQLESLVETGITKKISNTAFRQESDNPSTGLFPFTLRGTFWRAPGLMQIFTAAYLRLGELFSRSSPEYAEKYYAGAIVLDSKNAKAYVARGNIWLRQARTSANSKESAGGTENVVKFLTNALADFDKALGLDPGHAEAHYGKGMALAEWGLLEDAISQYSAAILHNPMHAQAYTEMALANLTLGLEACRREGTPPNAPSVFLHPDELLALPEEEFNKLGAIDPIMDAFDNCDKAIKLDPKLARALYIRSILNNLLGNSDSADEDFRTACSLDPEMPPDVERISYPG
ncbi:MAG: tetratricopeptide repeat protein [Candidatus Burarchaeum sp.]|nr:tetratricopeptide repeat protein [Candidatus Burarchaeum sp.]MDO8339526.1 tetratricopeptide repeat protein [Candidatus Burarchaeum sp.]